MSGYELRQIGPDEAERFIRAFEETFHWELKPEHVEVWSHLVEPERTWVAVHDGAFVATTALISFPTLTVPGARVPLAGVSAVGVHPLHRGRRLLDRLMRTMLESVHERGTEAMAALWASEAGIYGRYGFGVASRIWELTVRSPEARLSVPPPASPPRGGAPRDLLDDIRAVHEAEAQDRVGMIGRVDVTWDYEVADLEHRREDSGKLRALVWDGPEGPAGYALYRVRKRWTDNHPDDDVIVLELVARTPDAARALWGHLIGLALTRRVEFEAGAPDEALPHLLTDHRAVGGPVRDGLFLRLVDVPRALAERRYASPVDIVLEVADPVCPWNAGRYRLAGDADGATCDPTDATPDLALTATELGAAHLGGTTLAELAAAGRVEEHARGALAAASHAFKGVREPWTFQGF